MVMKKKSSTEPIIFWILLTTLCYLLIQIWVYDFSLLHYVDDELPEPQHSSNAPSQQQSEHNNTKNNFGSISHRKKNLEEKTNILLKDNALLERKNAQLKAEVEDFKNGFDATVEIARHKHGYIQNEETYYDIKSR
ncbi:MAG: septum formation initiator family protein [Neisseriaceae bacterium]|nr:septum formation initiator family protein [Neisseriaceae bacterium]